MAFQMIHMEIAYRLLGRIPQIMSPAEFILGSVAPDSVHMDPAYNMDMKVKSHLFEGCGTWSDTQDYQRWERNIHSFYQTIAGREGAGRDFGLGICVHCLTDYWNDIKIWRRLQREYIPPMNIDTFKKAYYPEAKGIDLWLYQNSGHTELIRKLLSEACVMEVAGMIDREALARQRDHLLNTQYAVDRVDLSAYRYLSEDALGDFIEYTVGAIAETVLGWLGE